MRTPTAWQSIPRRAHPAPAVRVFEEVDTLFEVAVREVVETLADVLARRKVAYLALSGGSTPRRLYELLASEPWRGQVDWSRVEIFWGDERMVPPDDDASNYRLARRTLLDPLDVPQARVHRVAGEETPEEAVRLYEEALGGVPGSPPHFDLILLGMGADGHTASLFPGEGAVEEEARWAVATESPDPPHSRISLTLPVLSAARRVLFLVTGADKAEAVGHALREDEPPPAGRVRGEETVWLLDREAARSLVGEERSA